MYHGGKYDLTGHVVRIRREEFRTSVLDDAT